MAIFGSGLMQGESAGIPTGGLLGGGLSGNNALLNIGLGILANNQGNYGAFGPAVGRGALQGIQATQQAQQLGQMGQMRDLQMQQARAEAAKVDARNKAIADFKLKHPELADAVDLDPSLAIKAAYPTIGQNSADPYYNFIPTESGIASGNARTGKLELLTGPDGKPFIKTSDSPKVRGAVKSAESGAAAAYKPNTDIPGMVMTDEQLARQSYGGGPMPFAQLPMINAPAQPMQAPNQQLPSNNFNLPYPVTMGAPGTTATDRAEGITGESSIQLRDPRRPNAPAPRVGIVVPTPEQQAALTTTATTQAKTNVDTQADKAKNVRKSDQFLSVAQEAKKILEGKNAPTSSGVGAAIDAAGGLLGMAPAGADEATSLEALSGWMVANVPRMEGPQSNFDVQNYQTMAGAVGDRTKPLSVRKAALDKVISLQEKYKSLNQDGEQPSTPKVEAAPMPAKPSALTLKKGTVYQTPMGALKWNGKAFED